MPHSAAKAYIKHPTTTVGNVFKIASSYAHDALKTLSSNKVLDEELREEVMKIIDERLPVEKFKPFRDLIQMHYIQGERMEDIAKFMGLSLPQIYDLRMEVQLVVADSMFLSKVLIKAFKPDLIEMLKSDPDMIAAVCQSSFNNKP